MVASGKNFPLLDELLSEQQRLATPVARFAEAHALDAAPALAAVYRDLIPLTAPRAGERYAFEVDLDACSGCKACVSACHALNGLDEQETWRDVGLVIGGDERRPFQQTVTSACHHCADPACLNGCPVLAYEQDPATGIVRHLDDQCIGCQYCILKCPYDAPKYNARLGIVRKCDLCHGRLAADEAPACVQACPTHAIRVVTVSTSAARSEMVEERAFLKAAPAPGYTRPTTRYVSQRAQPADLRAADAGVLRSQPPHWPLAIMLTLLPLGVGGHALAALTGSPAAVLVAWTAGASGLAASVAHLGQPRRAWRIFLGWRQSWLSREAVVFGAWFAVATLALGMPALAGAAAALGALGLGCSVMIYVDTRRRLWRWAQTAPRFLGGAVVLGAALAVALGLAPALSAAVLAMATLVKLAVEARPLRAANADDDAPPSPELNTARLLTTGRLRAVFGLRVAAAIIGNLLAPAMVAAGTLPMALGWSVLAGALFGELAERHLFFRAVDAPKMPGMPT